MGRKALVAAGVAVLVLAIWLGWRAASGPTTESSPDGASSASRTAASSRTPSGAQPSPATDTPELPGKAPGAVVTEGTTPPVAEPMREEEGTLRVEVASPFGPHPGARVRLYLKGAYEPATGQPSWRLAGTGITNDSGVVVLPARAGHYLVSARTDDFAPARADVTRPRGEAQTSVRLMLDLGAEFDGTTVERSSGAPVPLVQLTLTPRLSSTETRVSAPEEERYHITSDARGIFRYEGLTRGEYQLEARTPGYAPKRLPRVLVPSSGFDVKLEGSAFIEGFVELSDGKPAAQATVRAFGMDEVVGDETGAGGGFSLDVPPGTYQLSARLGDKTGSSSSRVVVGAGMTVKDVRIRLGGSTSITGVVRKKGSGQPLGDAMISVSPSGSRGDLARASSGADGRFEVSGLAPGAYDLVFKARGFKGLRRGGLTLLEGQQFELIAELEANGRIEGTVVDGSKRPIAGVQVIPQRKWGPMEDAISTVTDAAGAFAIEVPPGDVYVAVRRPESEVNSRTLVKVEPGQTHKIQIQLSDEGTLEGTVRLTGGRLPPKPVTVYARRLEAPRSEGIEVPATAEGTFTMRVGAGRYQLSAWMADARFLSVQEKVVTLKAGQTLRADLEVSEGKKPLAITVLEPNGAPSVGAVVMGSEAGKSNILLEDLTDESGQVTMMADPLGSDALHLWATNGGRGGDLPVVPVASGAATIQLSPGARLTGSVRSAGGRAVNGFQLLVATLRTDEDFITQQRFEFTGDRFVVDDIPPGRLAITATLPDGRAGKVEATATSGGTSEVEVLVDAGGGVTGRLLDAKTGEPINQAFVDVDGLMSQTTGPDGRFRVDDIAPGPHRITAWSRQHDIVDKQVTITPGKVLDLGDWRMGPLTRAR
jgi:hypothetical protein